MIPRRKIRYYNKIIIHIIYSFFSKSINMGKYIQEFETAFAKHIGVDNSISTSSGRSAYSLILDALHIPIGSEVLLPSYTYKEIFNITIEKGLIPILIDIDPLTFNLNPLQIKNNVTNKTKVIVATHIFGMPCNIEEILKIAQHFNIIVIEDCAHSLGSTINGKKTGSFGKASFYSFESTKIINTFGGGMITTNDSNLLTEISKNLSLSKNNTYKILSKIIITVFESFLIESFINFILFTALRSKKIKLLLNKLYFSSHNKLRPKPLRLSNLQCLFGLIQLPLIDLRNLQRKNAVAIYKSLLDKRLHFPSLLPNTENVYYYFVVILPDEYKKDINEFRISLSRQGIDIGILDELTDNLSLCNKTKDLFPVTEKIFKRGFQLPIFDNISKKHILNICSVINYQLNLNIQN